MFVDSWRDFLQINPSDLQIQDDKLQIPQQSIILNTAAVNPTTTTTTIHVPLITIQNSNSNPNKNHLSATNICNINGDIKLTTTTTPQKLTAAMIRISNSNANTSTRNLLVTTTSTQNNHHSSNKRHILTTNGTTPTIETKRIKSNSIEGSVAAPIPSPTTTTQLFQQLMAPTQKQKTKIEWSNCGTFSGHQQQQLQQESLQQQHHQQEQQQLPSNNSSTNSSVSSSPTQSSNSVLKNLLVSGCDVSAGYCIVPMRPKKLAKA